MRNALLMASGLALGSWIAGGVGSGVEAQTPAKEVGTEPGPVWMGIGSSQPNQNDLCWVLFRDRPGKGQKIDHDRFALCLYRALNNGQAFDLADVREVTYDFKLAYLASQGHNPQVSPQVLKVAYEKSQKTEERPVR